MTSRTDPVAGTGGDAGILDFLKGELAARPGRLASALRIAALTLLVVIVSETFRIPLPAYSAYIVFFASKEETASTLLTGIVLTVAVTLAVLAAILVYVFSAGEPGLRLPLMALIAFMGLYLSRISALGPAAFAAGFVLTVSLTLIDGIPPFAGLPPSEILTQSVLWLWVVVMIPIGLVVLVNLLTGRAPSDLFRDGLALRLEAAAALPADPAEMRPADRRRFAALAEAGMGDILRHLHYEALLGSPTAVGKAGGRALAAAGLRIMMAVQAWSAGERGRPVPEQAARTLRMLAGRLRRPAGSQPADLAAPDGESWPLRRLWAFMRMLQAGLEGRTGPAAPPASRPGLISRQALADPDHLRFALKTTLAAMLAYFTYTLLDWPEIRTALITCFFVTYGNFGESVHRMTLRLSGAAIGGALGLLAVIVVLPNLTSITGLCLLIGPLAFAAAWIANGSDRLAYAGMQVALAFFLCVLVGHGPQIDLAEARDRLVGIILGNLIVSLVFLNIWPVGTVGQARAAMADALRQVAGLLTALDAADGTLLAFDAAAARARRLMTFGRFEPRRLKDGIADPALIEAIDDLAGLAVLLADAAEPRAGWRQDLAAWTEEAALRVNGGAGDRRRLPPPPRIPSSGGGNAAGPWWGMLEDRAAALHRRLAGDQSVRGNE